ncbi:probable ATP-dependent RNA helicase CG8611 [Condylostylus longicornis]|uniref:probable ATP-dependent RNA helicase CG8611 n=1 Tax=Condylostylus longicornis TaxID=2530218 RepID=UPI00244DFCF7|nr:probable ATP-dependent RNA helicase CG8611 [Condylostylus longicornis]
MDLMFNITSAPSPAPKVKEKPAGKLLKQKVKVNSKNKFKENGSKFSFQFTKNDKIKAVVARRRPTTILNGQNLKTEKNVINNHQSSQPKNYVMRPSFPETNESFDENHKKKNYVLRPKDDVDDIDSNNDNVNETKAQNGDDIFLNLTTSVDPQLANKSNVKLSRTERINKKREDKLSFRKEKRSGRVLTEEEINEGIKKFSKLPQKSKKKKPNICQNIETKIIGQRFVKPIVEKIFTGCSLETLNIHPHLVKTLADLMNITELTAVQQKAIPKALEGRDLLVRSQTGSGKTLAYALPIVQKLQEVTPKLTRNSGIMALVIVPTRELAIQTYEVLIKLLKPFTWIVSGYLCGGEKRKSEKARLRKGINILVGTSGRLLDHLLNTDSFKLDKLKFFVLDEADRLLELGYEKDVSKIVHTIDEHKRNAEVADEFRPSKSKVEEKPDNQLQRLLLSATLTPAIQKLAGLTLKNPIFIDNSDENVIDDAKQANGYANALEEAVKDEKLVLPENLSLSYVVVHPKLRLVTLSGLLAKEFSNRKTKVLVFLATTEMANFLHDILNEALTMRILDEEVDPDEDNGDDNPLLAGVKFFKLHGSMTQVERGAIFKDFKNCSSGILLTTDVAGRGIDVPEVDLVIQYSPPLTISDFVHRAGRTARAGKKGRSVLFLASEEVEFIKILEDRRIRISQEILEKCLKSLKDADDEAHTVQEATSNLQHKFEELIEDDKELRNKAYKAYTSWVRNYASFPKELKPIFNIKKAHMGHYAKSFALKEPPSKFVSKNYAPKPALPNNRLTYSERKDEKKTDSSETRKRKHNLSTTVSSGSRLTNFTRDSQTNQGPRNFKENKNKHFENKLAQLSQKSLMMSVSEFDSGIPSKKRKT